MFSTKRSREGGRFFHIDSTTKPSRNVINITRKGDKKSRTVDLNNVEEVVIRLAQHPDRKITSLSGKLEEDYKQAVRYVELFFGHEHYVILLGIIEKHFSKFNRIVPGTIAGWMYGCSKDTDMDSNACSSLCAGSVRLDPDAQLCDLPVVIAQYEGGQFNFFSKNDDKKTHVAIVHVSYTSLKTFPGFNDNDKKWFYQMGYNEIYLYGMTGSSGKYVNLYAKDGNNGLVDVKNVKSRIGTVESSDSGTDPHTIYWIGGIIIIILIIAFVYFMYRNNQK